MSGSSCRRQGTRRGRCRSACSGRRRARYESASHSGAEPEGGGRENAHALAHADLVVDGILTIVNANTARKQGLSWGWELTAGIVYIVAGIAIFIAPLAFALASGIVILWLMAFGMLVRGIFTLASKAFRGWSKLLGVLDIIFAIIVMIVVFTSPAAAVTALLWIVGVYVIVFGIFLIVMAFTARSQAKRAMNG